MQKPESDARLGLKIVLADVASESAVELTFEGFVGYRNINESYRRPGPGRCACPIPLLASSWWVILFGWSGFEQKR